MTNPTIESIVTTAHTEDVPPDVLVSRLTAREDAMRDQLHMAGMQFGLFPQIVAEVLAEVGLGTPPTEEERAMIRAAFVALMEEIERQQQQGPGGV